MSHFENILRSFGFALLAFALAAFVITGCENVLAEDDDTNGAGDDDETTGTLTVTLSGAEEQNDQTLVAGVWEEGDHPADTPPIEGTAKTDTIASGAATVAIPPWDGMEAGTRYDVFIFIFTEGRSSGAPEPGKDYVYESTSAVPWIVDGDRTIDTAYEDYIVIPNE